MAFTLTELLNHLIFNSKLIIMLDVINSIDLLPLSVMTEIEVDFWYGKQDKRFSKIGNCA